MRLEKSQVRAALSFLPRGLDQAGPQSGLDANEWLNRRPLGTLAVLVVVANDLGTLFSGRYRAVSEDAMPPGAADIRASAHIETDRMLCKPFPLLPGVGARLTRFKVGERFRLKEFSSHDGV